MTLKTKTVQIGDRNIQVHELSIIGQLELSGENVSIASIMKQCVSDKDYDYL